MPDPNSDHVVEPQQPRGCGLELHRDSEVKLVFAQGLAQGQPLRGVRGLAEPAGVAHVDRLGSVALENRSHVEMRYSVGAGEHPIATAWEHLPAQTLPLERTRSNDARTSKITSRDGPDDLGRGLEFDGEQGAERRVHELVPPPASSSAD